MHSGRMGNHGDFPLDETSLTSPVLDIDWAESTITVPWGVRNDDEIMQAFDKVPGLAWHYDYSTDHDDSAYVSCRTGDILTMYGAGSEYSMQVFDLIAAPPTQDDNMVIPKNRLNEAGYYGTPRDTPFEVTTDNGIMDTIRNVPFACRVDTLFKYLEKAPQATWDIVWIDGLERVDLKNGDLLRVTSENGTPKDYFIKTSARLLDDNTRLSAITWPDIPGYLMGTSGWSGDTIPGFSKTIFTYTMDVPYDYEGIPLLSAMAEDPNATVEITRATSLIGSIRRQDSYHTCNC